MRRAFEHIVPLERRVREHEERSGIEPLARSLGRIIERAERARVVVCETLTVGADVQAVQARLPLHNEQLELLDSHLAVWEHSSWHLDALQVRKRNPVEPTVNPEPFGPLAGRRDISDIPTVW